MLGSSLDQNLFCTSSRGGVGPIKRSDQKILKFLQQVFSLTHVSSKSQGCFLFSSLGCLFFLDWGYFEKKMIEAVDIALQPGKLWDSAKSALGDTSTGM